MSPDPHERDRLHDTDRPLGKAGHEHDHDYVDRDVTSPAAVEREGEYTDTDLASDAPDATREGDYTDRDVTDDDQDTPPSSYVSSDVPR